MDDQRGEGKAARVRDHRPVRAVPGRQGAKRPAAGKTAYVINLCSSMRPITLAETLTLSGLGDCRLRQSRRKEDGRERYRLHLGLFSSDIDAARVVSMVRQDFPAALVVRASAADMREFDGYVSLPNVPRRQNPVETVEIPRDQFENVVLETEPPPQPRRLRPVKLREKRMLSSTTGQWVVATPPAAAKPAVQQRSVAKRPVSKPAKKPAVSPAEELSRANRMVGQRRTYGGAEPEKPKVVTKPKPQLIDAGAEIADQLTLSDTATVKHLYVRAKPESLATRLVDRLKGISKKPKHSS